MADSHSTSMSPDPPLSLASQLPQGIFGEHKIGVHTGPLWERACPRRRTHIQHRCRLTHRFRWQASSHRGSSVNTKLAFTPAHCGSGLARDGGLIHIDSPDHRFRWQASSTGSSVNTLTPVERLARDGGLIQHRCRLTHRFRWQASSHRGSSVNTKLAFTPAHCGSGLARDGGLTFNIDVA